jgi:hypothetical protein
LDLLYDNFELGGACFDVLQYFVMLLNCCIQKKLLMKKIGRQSLQTSILSFAFCWTVQISPNLKPNPKPNPVKPYFSGLNELQKIMFKKC